MKRDGVSSNLPAVAIYVGNVIQLRRNSDVKYRHSIYVVDTVNVSQNQYSGIMTVQHSTFVKRSLADAVTAWGGSNCYARRLAFQSASFAQ